MQDGLTAPPQDLTGAARYPLADAAGRARIAATGREGLAREGCAMPPGIRSESDPNDDAVARAHDGDPAVTRAPAITPGTLVLFRGKYAVHRLTPIEGARPRIIALFSYGLRPDMQFSDRSRMNVLGRTQPRARDGALKRGEAR